MEGKAYEIQAMVDKETTAWNQKDAEALTTLFHPDAVWAWPPDSGPDSGSPDPATWLLVLGKYDHDRWKQVWTDLFDSHDLTHNNRHTVCIVISDLGDAAFAVVDIDTLWRHKQTGEDFQWKGRTCKIYTLTPQGWKMITQIGVIDYSSFRKNERDESGRG